MTDRHGIDRFVSESKVTGIFSGVSNFSDMVTASVCFVNILSILLSRTVKHFQ